MKALKLAKPFELAKTFKFSSTSKPSKTFTSSKTFKPFFTVGRAKAVGFALAFMLSGLFAVASGAAAAPPVAVPPHAPAIQVDWQYPAGLPRQYRNHCAVDRFTGRPYCSNHCGFDYQFYYCSPGSSGCCRVGFGYCDWNGLLTCSP
jgi:hypothetical protein